jgi:hypothetical protein
LPSRFAAERSLKRRAAFPFAIGGELSGISLRRRFVKRIAEILLHSNYEETDPEKLAREVGLRPARQTDPGKLAREVDVRPARDNALVPDQKERRDEGLAV